ncbi:MAG: potassium channel protein, partial [Rhodobacterales bacterium]|nr:potassium channel protein [Rhodobacterales bacterium]
MREIGVKRHTLKQRTDRFLHHPITELVLLVLILLSVLLMLLELMMSRSATLDALVLVGQGITALFVVELSARFWVAQKKSRFFSRYWLDILAIVPLIRPLRFFRVLRVLRLFRAGILINRQATGFGGAFRGSRRSELVAILVGMIVLIASSADILLYAERGNPQFSTFEEALWFASMSLVGGEPIGGQPDSDLGRWVTLFLMLGGMTLFGVLVGTVSASMVRRLSAGLEEHAMELDELRKHTVVCGWNGSGPTVLRELFAVEPGRCVVLITEEEDIPKDLPDDLLRQSLYHVHGDYTRVSVLEMAGLRQATNLILLRDELIQRSEQDRDARTVLAALTAEHLSSGVYTVAELHSAQSQEILELAGVEEIVVGHWYSGVIIGAVARNRGLVRVLDELLTVEGNRLRTISVPPSYVGRTVEDVHHQLFVEHRAVLVALVHEQDGGRHPEVN